MKDTLPLRAQPGEKTIDPTMELVLPAVRENLETIRSQVTQFLELQLGPRRARFPLEEVMLALQEACTNVVRHAYDADEAPGRIGVQAKLTRHLLRFTVTDEGPGYDPACVPPPDFTRPQEGGYGLHLMRQTMSRVTYRRTAGHNELILDKALHDADGART